jgi:tRNA-specific 2-thiouridylase
MHWLYDPLEDVLEADVKISNTHPRAGATLRILENGNVSVKYKEPQVAIAPGQSSVFYVKERVLGGGFIANIKDVLFDNEDREPSAISVLSS